MHEIAPGIHMRSRISAERGMDLRGYAVVAREGAVLVDRPRPREEEWERLDALAPFEAICVRNRKPDEAIDDPHLLREVIARRAGLDFDASSSTAASVSQEGLRALGRFAAEQASGAAA